MLVKFVPVAQLDSATDYESVGREFESLRGHHIFILALSVEVVVEFF